MCYELILSTTSSEDLSKFNEEKIRFEKEIPSRLPADSLSYPNRWYVGSRTGCSCTFRHLYDSGLGFGVPVDWYPEEQSDIEATLLFVRLIKSLLLMGENVDCIDLWEGNGEEPFHPISVNLSQIRDEEFRFFENHHFDFTLNI